MGPWTEMLHGLLMTKNTTGNDLDMKKVDSTLILHGFPSPARPSNMAELRRH